MKHFTIILSLISIIFSACTSGKKTFPAITIKETMIDSLPGECPYLTKDTKGNSVLSWIRMINDSTTAFCYAVWKDSKTFTGPVVIPGSGNIQPHGENLPKIIFKPSGEIIALWGAANPNPKNNYSGLVFYVQSFDDGQTWTTPKSLVSDTTSYDQRYYDVALLPDGEAGVIWLDNRTTTPLEGAGLFFARSNGKNGFLNDRLISQPCCPCCRTDLFIDSKGFIHILYRSIIQDSIRDMVHMVSTDNGQTFSVPARISNDNWIINGCPHTGPAMAETSNGLQFAWFTGGEGQGCYYSHSKDNGISFSSRSIISESGSHPQITSLTNNDVMVVWDETVQTNNKYHNRIGLQKRNAEGISSGNNFITADTVTSTYPVVSCLGMNAALIAYSRKKGNKNYVAYQVVTYQK